MRISNTGGELFDGFSLSLHGDQFMVIDSKLLLHVYLNLYEL